METQPEARKSFLFDWNLLMKKLSDDLIGEIFSFMEMRDIHNMMLISREFYELMSSDAIYWIVRDELILIDEFMPLEQIYDIGQSRLIANTEDQESVLKKLFHNHPTELRKTILEHAKENGREKRIKNTFFSYQKIQDLIGNQLCKEEHVDEMKKFKLVGVGSQDSGKTRLLCQLVNPSIIDNNVPNILQNVVIKCGKKGLLDVWDCSGQEGFERLRPLNYVGTDVFLLCFSINNRQTLIDIKQKFVREIIKYRPDSILILVGCESKVEESSIKVSNREAELLARQLGCFTYVSMVENFDNLLDLVWKALDIYQLKKPNGEKNCSVQ